LKPTDSPTLPAASGWLRTLYFARAAFSLAWVLLAFTVAPGSMAVASVLLVLYPAWDALANLVDAQRCGGLAANAPQALNAAASTVAAVAMAIAVGRGMPAVFVVFGAWAIVAGLLQLATAVRRWKLLGAQWPMALSGAQSALAGAFFVKLASGAAPEIQRLAGYAAVGAVYFLVSGTVLLHRHRKALRGALRA
jgi:uncharacterized membrane protein HdeD (DUF308 family)